MKQIILDLPVYSFHIDSGQHVSNIVYIQWMEIGRLQLLEEIGMPIDKIARDQGIAPVLMSTEITYRKQLYLGERVRMELWLSELGNASAVMEFRFQNGKGEEVATGRQKGIFLNVATQRPHRLNESERKLFEQFLEGLSDSHPRTTEKAALNPESRKD